MSRVSDFVNRTVGRPRALSDEIEHDRQVDFDNERLVYFVRAGVAGAVKIGFTEKLQKRLERMQVEHSEPLVLLGAVRGGEPLEQELHRRFTSDRIRGEWFRASLKVMSGITSLLNSPRVVVRGPQWVHEFLKQKEKKA